MSIEWLCTRCAEKTGKTPEPDPVVLRLCTECKVENWVRPFGHTGEDVVPSDEEYQVAQDKQIAESMAVREARRTGTVKKELGEERSAPVTKAVEVLEDVVVESTIEEVVAETVDEDAARKAEIEALKAKIAELEK